MFGLLLACFLFTLLGTVFSQSVSITDQSAFSSQRSCARGCVGSSVSGPLFLASKLSCAQPYDNSCFCRSDLQQKAQSYLQSCVNSACTNSLDASSAVAVYDAYCTSAGFVKAAVTTGTQSSFTTSTVNISSLPEYRLSYILTNTQSTGIGSSIETSSVASNTTGATSNTIGGLTKAEFIGIIVSAVGSLAGVIGVWITCKRHRG
ncbi:hypothetical protein BGZ60DRAFT_534162 [Tricladium varicosporioides]|nr:hypothetical protein BGZ60DRAFT_534162 [Hymenoscyphus varicosporioides]